MTASFAFLFTDQFWFLLFEACIFLTFLFALVEDMFYQSIARVIHGEKSRNFITAFWIVMATVVISVVFQISKYPTEGKVGLYILNLVCVGYLSFYSSWFTNELRGLLGRFENRQF